MLVGGGGFRHRRSCCGAVIPVHARVASRWWAGSPGGPPAWQLALVGLIFLERLGVSGPSRQLGPGADSTAWSASLDRLVWGHTSEWPAGRGRPHPVRPP